MLSSPRRPDTTIRIFSSAVYCLRVLRRISRTVLSAGSFLLIDFWLIFVPFGHYDEPEILRYAITSIRPKGADVRQHLPAAQPSYPARADIGESEVLRLEAIPPDLDYQGYERRTGGRIDYLLVWGDTRAFRETKAQRKFIDRVRTAFEPRPIQKGRNFQLFRRLNQR